MAATYEHLRNVLTDEFEIEPELIAPEAHLFDDLDIDSIDAIDMLARLRELTGIALPTDALKQVRTIGDVVALVDAHSQGHPVAHSESRPETRSGTLSEAKMDGHQQVV